jgi:hypothetical protein
MTGSLFVCISLFMLLFMSQPQLPLKTVPVRCEKVPLDKTDRSTAHACVKCSLLRKRSTLHLRRGSLSFYSNDFLLRLTGRIVKQLHEENGCGNSCVENTKLRFWGVRASVFTTKSDRIWIFENIYL